VLDPSSQDSDRPEDALAWAQLLLTVLDEGRRTATYELAVLLALLDCCVLGADVQGRPPQSVPVHDLARRVLELNWRQVRPYARRQGPEPVEPDEGRDGGRRERAAAGGRHCRRDDGGGR
jgi:hypothetical protein